MQPIDMIEYTFEVKVKQVKMQIPAFVSEWDAVYGYALEQLYVNKFWDIEDVSCIETRPYRELPMIRG